MRSDGGRKMGVILKNINVAGSKGERTCEALFDTGASASFVRESALAGIADPQPAPSPLKFKLGDKRLVEASKTVVLRLQIDGYHLYHMFLVVEKLPQELVIGADFLQRWKIKLDPATEQFIIDPAALEIFLV
jgi:predicted aspartyl protease